MGGSGHSAASRLAAIAITEPDAGSDVAGTRTVARRDGNDSLQRPQDLLPTALDATGRLSSQRLTESGHSGYNLLVIEKERRL